MNENSSQSFFYSSTSKDICCNAFDIAVFWCVDYCYGDADMQTVLMIIVPPSTVDAYWGIDV